ncbi:MAG: cobaltochelatase subunit CobN [Schwartzia sp. (in: firmicutes)]
MKIALFTNISRSYCLHRQNLERLAREAPRIEGLGWLFESGTEWSAEWAARLDEADVILILWMGTGLDTPFLRQAVRRMERRGSRYLILVENPGTDKVSAGFSPEEIRRTWQYFRYDGADNLYHCMLWLGHEFGGTPYAPEEPKLLPWHGVWHPKWTEMAHCQDAAGYLAAHYVPGRPTVGVMFYRTEWLMGDFSYQTALIEAIEAQGMNVIAIFTNTFRNEALDSPTLMDAVNRYFFRDGARLVDVIVNTMKFSLKAAGTSIEEWMRIDVPLLEAYTVLGERAEWEASPAGLNPMEVSIAVSLPEFDGVIHSVPIAARVKDDVGDVTWQLMEERMARLAAKAKKWALLGKKPNQEKKIAIVFHNYPPTNSNIGSAAGLDSPESVRRLLEKMQGAGYTVETIPEDSKSFMKLLTDNATNDRRFISAAQVKDAYGHLSAEHYARFFTKLPDAVRAQLTADWGEAPGDVFNYEGDLLIPGTLNGNIFITVQPPRGFGEDPGKILHDPAAAPTHHYIGFYHWLRDIWQADAVVHIGTHGSLEWLPGKGTALSSSCYPDISLGDLPDVYPYWMTIVGEGIQAKRRGAACLISHLSPPMQLSGSYEEIQELEQALDEYIHFRQTQPDNLETVKAIVREKAAACHFSDDIPEGDDFDDYVGRLHNDVTDIKNMQIRTGLHIMGQPPEGEGLAEYVEALVRLDNGDVPSLVQLLAAEAGYSYDALLADSSRLTPEGVTYGMKLDALGQEGHRLITFLETRDYDPAAVRDALAQPEAAAMSEAGRQRLGAVLAYICESIVPNLRRTTEELTNTLRALSGGYIEPSSAGAPSSGGADLLPTGRNFYGLDPRLLPTPAAWELGKRLGDEVVSQYIADEGRYPEACGIVLWAGANMRSHGQCVAEFLYLMGVRPVWQRPSQRVVGLDVIPLEELKRPRIDVTGRISGLFRDSMPNAIRWLDAAAKLVSELDEADEDNYVRKHVKADAAWLEGEGETAEAAWQKASYRIFGDPPGAYGAGVGALLESKAWETLDDIAAVYTRWSGTAYGGDALPGDYEPEIFRRRMGALDVTIKNEDNRETNMFSSDDYNAYHGGMIATVRAIAGKAPRSYSGDSTDRKRVKVRTVQDEAKRVFRGECMNPKFIEGMKKHGYKGALDLANTLAHSYQWDATSKVMEDWMYEKYAEKYALDPAMQEWMKEVNPWALQRMAAILLEAEKRALWQAQPETKEALTRLYMEMEGELEERAEG